MTMPASASQESVEFAAEFPLEPYTLATAQAIIVPCGVNVGEADASLTAVLEFVARARSKGVQGLVGAPHVRSVILDLRCVAHVSEPAYAMMHHLRRQCGLLDIEVFAIPPEEGSPLVRMWRAINGWFFPAPPRSLESRAVMLTESTMQSTVGE
ncbi:MAG: hypothetical protein ACR2M1_13665 [Gemmatimonadaceae bacterium]